MEFLSQRLLHFGSFWQILQNLLSKSFGPINILTRNKREGLFQYPHQNWGLIILSFLTRGEEHISIFTPLGFFWQIKVERSFFFLILSFYSPPSCLIDRSFLMLSEKNRITIIVLCLETYRIYLKIFIWFQGLVNIIQCWIYCEFQHFF